MYLYTLFLRNADQVSVGDEVLVNEKDELTSTKVINISDFTMQGNVYVDLFQTLY